MLSQAAKKVIGKNGVILPLNQHQTRFFSAVEIFLTHHLGIDQNNLLKDPNISFGKYFTSLPAQRKKFFGVLGALGIKTLTEEENKEAMKAEESANKKRESKAKSKAELKKVKTSQEDEDQEIQSLIFEPMISQLKGKFLKVGTQFPSDLKSQMS